MCVLHETQENNRIWGGQNIGEINKDNEISLTQPYTIVSINFRINYYLYLRMDIYCVQRDAP